MPKGTFSALGPFVDKPYAIGERPLGSYIPSIPLLSGKAAWDSLKHRYDGRHFDSLGFMAEGPGRASDHPFDKKAAEGTIRAMGLNALYKAAAGPGLKKLTDPLAKLMGKGPPPASRMPAFTRRPIEINDIPKSWSPLPAQLAQGLGQKPSLTSRLGSTAREYGQAAAEGIGEAARKRPLAAGGLLAAGVAAPVLGGAAMMNGSNSGTSSATAAAETPQATPEAAPEPPAYGDPPSPGKLPVTKQETSNTAAGPSEVFDDFSADGMYRQPTTDALPIDQVPKPSPAPEAAPPATTPAPSQPTNLLGSADQPGDVAKFLGQYWPHLAAGGLGAMGLYQLYNMYQERQKKKRQEELLPYVMKAAEDLTAFEQAHPLVAGFLRRCGEADLSEQEINEKIAQACRLDPGVRAAFEKCAFGGGGIAPAGSNLNMPTMPKPATSPSPAAPAAPAKPAAPLNYKPPQSFGQGAANLGKNVVGGLGDALAGTAGPALGSFWGLHSAADSAYGGQQGTPFSDAMWNEGKALGSAGWSGVGKRLMHPLSEHTDPVADHWAGAAEDARQEGMPDTADYLDNAKGRVDALTGSAAAASVLPVPSALKPLARNPVSAYMATAEPAQQIVNTFTPDMYDEKNRHLGTTRVPISPGGMVDRYLMQPMTREMFAANDRAAGLSEEPQQPQPAGGEEQPDLASPWDLPERGGTGQPPQANPPAPTAGEQQTAAVPGGDHPEVATNPDGSPITTPDQAVQFESDLKQHLAADPEKLDGARQVAEQATQTGNVPPEVTEGAAARFGFAPEAVAKMPWEQQLLMWLGVGLGAIGLLDGLTNEEGGLGGWLLGLLGLGTAAGVAANAGVFGAGPQQMTQGTVKQLGDWMGMGSGDKPPTPAGPQPGKSQQPGKPLMSLNDYAQRQLEQQIVSKGRDAYGKSWGSMVPEFMHGSMVDPEINRQIDSGLQSQGLDPAQFGPEMRQRWLQQIKARQAG